MQELLRDKVLSYVKLSGPVLPVQISKNFGLNILFASAVLAELVSKKDLMLSYAKIGESPIYYVNGQEHKLQMLCNHLGEKPRKIFNLLREKKILRDKNCEPWQRVALREIKDFAKAINVEVENNEEIFWRWYLFNENEAKSIIEKSLKKPEEIIPEKKIKEKTKELERFDLGAVDEYFKKNKIEVVNRDLIRKNKEINFIVEVQSEIGKIRFFAKFLDKKKINDGDLSLAYNKGSSLKLPVMFLSTGELTKKANSYIEKELRGLVFRCIK